MGSSLIITNPLTRLSEELFALLHGLHLVKPTLLHQSVPSRSLHLQLRNIEGGRNEPWSRECDSLSLMNHPSPAL